MPEFLSWCDFCAGWFGGIAALIVGHPLDTIKVRQQTLDHENAKIPQIIGSTIKKEGIHGFYKGLSYPLLAAGCYNSLLFGIYGNVLRGLSDPGDMKRTMCCEGDSPAGKNWHNNVFIAGCVAGVGAVLFGCPVENVKIKLQSQRGTVNNCGEIIYKGPWHCLTSLYKTYGLAKGVFRGSICTLWRDVPTFGLYYLAYEHILCMFKSHTDRSPDKSITSQIVAGGIAGVLSWITVVPLDVIKSRIQADDFANPKYKGIIHTARKCIEEEGWKVLFRGTLLMTIRAFPVNAACFLGYEFFKSKC